MQKKSCSLLIALFMGVCFLHAQEKSDPIILNDSLAIEQTIQMYFDGWMTGDTTKLGKAMHATCQLKSIKDNEVNVTNRAKYLGFFKPRPKLENTAGRIKAIDITGNIGSAKCEIETPKWLFTDYFNLLKLDDTWYIVDKIATRVEK